MQTNLTIPNALTCMRLLLTPVLAVLFLYDSFESRVAILFLIVICELTDMLDGYWARRFHQVTNLGKLLDPMSDSIYRDTIFICLAVIGDVHLLLVLPILYRDSVISTVRTLSAHRGIVVAARTSGKIKAISQAVVIILLAILRILVESNDWVAAYYGLIANGSMAVVCLITLVSAYDYLSTLLPIVFAEDADRDQGSSNG